MHSEADKQEENAENEEQGQGADEADRERAIITINATGMTVKFLTLQRQTLVPVLVYLIAVTSLRSYVGIQPTV